MYQSNNIESPLKLMDFELAVSCQHHPIEEQRGGEKYYRAPEMLQNRPSYGCPVDIWVFPLFFVCVFVCFYRSVVGV